ncbi:MAG: hypothetical protein GF416_06370 [Candidatus Altiarchaeales archaeon]|nr:hypothetical protein [Candidatus Altiarchaeales archaeon]MBD3416739.1 hypothetical protein [Candidatus Altiarchaeales archaeon]
MKIGLILGLVMLASGCLCCCSGGSDYGDYDYDDWDAPTDYAAATVASPSGGPRLDCLDGHTLNDIMCYKAGGGISTDASLCKQIDDPIGVAACLGGVAAVKDDPSLCSQSRGDLHDFCVDVSNSNFAGETAGSLEEKYPFLKRWE